VEGGTIMLDFEEAWRSTDMAIIVVSTPLDGFYYGVVFCSRLEQYKKSIISPISSTSPSVFECLQCVFCLNHEIPSCNCFFVLSEY
jgi:hypothetical protein